MPKCSGMRIAVFLLLLATTVAATAFAQNSYSTFVPYAQHAESIPLRNMPSIFETVPAPAAEHDVKTIPHVLPAAQSPQRDEVAQTMVGLSAAAPTLQLNFMGEGVSSRSLGGDPSDSNGAVGATQYVEWINTYIEIFNKTTGAVVVTPRAGNTLFAALGGDCANTNDGDPIAIYDKFAQRWVLSQFSVQNGTTTHASTECIAVSSTSDATGSYHLYAFTYPNFNDYPKMGVWSDKYLISYNMFAATTTPGGAGNFVGSEVCALDRANMLKGNAANQACLVSGSDWSRVPSDLDGLLKPPSTELGYFAEIDPLNLTSTSLILQSIKSVNFTTSTLVLNSPVTLNVSSYSEGCYGVSSPYEACIPQNTSQSTQKVQSLGDRMMYRLAYRNRGTYEALLAAHTVDVSGTGSGQTGIRWYEIRSPGTSPTIYQSGTYAPDSKFRFMPSIAMDHSGNIALGYSASSTSIDPSIYVSTRAPGDTLGTLSNETLVQTGSFANTGDARWGDYTAMTVDPVNDCHFWFIDQYLGTATGEFKWDTRIARFLIKGCGAQAVILTPTPGSTLSGASATFTWNKGLNVSNYTLQIGTTGVGSSNLDNINAGTALSTSVTNLPADGSTIYVRLLSTVTSVVKASNYTYVSGP